MDTREKNDQEEDDRRFEYEQRMRNQLDGHQNTPTQSEHQQNYLRNMLKAPKSNSNVERNQLAQFQQNGQQYLVNTPLTFKLLKRRSMSTNALKAKQPQPNDFSDNHLLEQNVPSQILVQIKETLNCQPPSIIMRKSSTAQMKKRQRILSTNALFSGSTSNNQQSQQQITQSGFNPINQNSLQSTQSNFQSRKPSLSASVQNKIKIESIQREQSDLLQYQQQQQSTKDSEIDHTLTLPQQHPSISSRKLSSRQQVYLDIFLKQKKNQDLSVNTANANQLTNAQKEGDSLKIPKNNKQITSTIQPILNQQQQNLGPSKDDQVSSCNTSVSNLRSKYNINSNIEKALISSKPSSNLKLRSNDVPKSKRKEGLIEESDITKLQNAYQSISIKERSPFKNPYYSIMSSQKQSRSNSVQNIDVNRLFQSNTQEDIPVIPSQIEQNLNALHAIIQQDSMLAKLNNPQCRHSDYLEVQDKIKDMTKLMFDTYSNNLLDWGKSADQQQQVNQLGFFSLFLSTLQKAFSEINSFISRIVIALPDQIAVDQMQNIKTLLEVILRMHSPYLNDIKEIQNPRLNNQKLKMIQDLSLLPTTPTLKFVELFNDLDKYFLIYEEQIESLDSKIAQQEEQIKEISDMLYGAEHTINMKNQLHQSQYLSNQMYHEQEEMLLKLNQSIEQNYTNRISELRQAEQQNTKEIEDNKKTINQLNKQINDLKEKLSVAQTKKKMTDQSSQINLILLNSNESASRKQLFKVQKYIKDVYPSTFRMSQNCVLAIANSILCDKVKDDYTAFISKQPYNPLSKYTSIWFMKQFGQQEVAFTFLNDFVESLAEIAEKDRSAEFFCSLIGQSVIKLKDTMTNQRGHQGILNAIKSIMSQSNLFYQIYYDIATSYRRKLEEKSDNYNRPYFFHSYQKDEQLTLKRAQQLVAHHLRQFLQDQDELDFYVQQFNLIELTEHIYSKTQKPYNYNILKQNTDLIQGKETHSFQQQLQKNAGITVPLSNIAQFVVDSVVNIESTRLLQFLYSLKTSQLEKMNKQLSIEEYKQTMLQYYPVHNKAFYDNSFAHYCLFNVVKIFENSNQLAQIKCLEKFTLFVIDCRTQDAFYAEIIEGQDFESPRTSPHSPKKLKHSNSQKLFSQIKLESINKPSTNDLDSPSKSSKSKILSKQKSFFQSNTKSPQKNKETLHDLSDELLEEESSSQMKSIQQIRAFQQAARSLPSSPKKSRSQSPKKFGKNQNGGRLDSASPSKRSVMSPMRSQQEFFFSTRILFRQEFENKQIDAFFKQHLNTFASIIIIEEVYNNIVNLIKKEQQTEERLRKTHDSFKYYLQTAKNQPYITTNYVARHDFIAHTSNAWDELRVILKFLSANFSKPSEPDSNIRN